MNDIISRDQVVTAYNNAPDIVRAVFNAELTTKIIVEIRNKYQLHIDSAGILAKEIGYLLLGITDPAKFMNRLKTAGIDAQTVSNIAKDINEKIFMPLQQQMKKGPPAPPKAIQGTAPMAPSPRPSAPSVATRPPFVTAQSPARPVSRFNLQNKIPPLNTPQATPSARPDLRSVLASVTSEVPRPSLRATEGAAKTKLLEDHEEPHIPTPKPSPVPVQQRQVSQIPQQKVAAPIPPRVPTPMSGAEQRPPTFSGAGAPKFVPTPNLTGAVAPRSTMTPNTEGPRPTFNTPPVPRPPVIPGSVESQPTPPSPRPNALIPGINLPPPPPTPVVATPPPKGPPGDPYREPID